ncbi:hypothetical protein QOT17_016489 [Balamuthia mandrillaris]
MSAAVQDIVTKLQDKKEDHGKALPLLRDLAAAASDAQIRESVVEAVAAVLELIRAHTAQSDLLKHAFTALAHLTSYSAKNQNEFMQEGGLEALLNGMKTCPDDAAVQREALKVLINISYSDEHEKAVVAGGAVDLVVKSMEHHSKDESVQHFACWVLLNLASAATPATTAAIIAAMGAHHSSRVVQHYGAFALEKIAAFHEDLRMEMVVKGAVEALAAASAYSELQVCVIRALGNLACNNETQTAVVSKGKGLPTVMAAMNDNPTDETLLTYACWALEQFASENPVNQQAIFEAKGVEAIITAMKAFPESKRLLFSALGALLNLSCNDDIEKASISTGVIEIALDTIKRHNDVLLRYSGVWLLANLSHTFDENRRYIAKNGGIDAIVAAMDEHKDFSDLMSHGCLALVNLGKLDENLELLKQKGGEHLHTCADAADDPHTQRAAEQLLHKMENN